MDFAPETGTEEPLTSADYSELRAAAERGGLCVSLGEGRSWRRLERLDGLNRRGLLRYGGLRPTGTGRAEVVYAISDAGRAASP